MKLFTRKYGNGPYLVILHGLFGSSDNWATIAKKLSDQFTVILVDQRNHGSSPHSEEHDYELMREDLHELARDLSIEKFFLAGHSMGGKTAIAFAMKYSEMLNGLVVADISPFKGGDESREEYKQHLTILKSMMSIDTGALKARSDAEAELLKTGLPEHIRGFILKNLQRNTDGSFSWKLNVDALLKNLDKIMKPLDRNISASVTITGFPVIFLKGENSDYLPDDDFEDIRKIFPAAEFVVIKGAGHWLHADNPEAVIRSIRSLM